MADRERGNKPATYKRMAAELLDERSEVKQWRTRISRAVKILQIPARATAAIEGDEYLTGTKKSKQGKVVYYRYMMPLLEDEHRQTVSDIPMIQVEPQIEVTEDLAPKVEDLLNTFLATQAGDIKAVCADIQWDEDRSGVGVGRLAWESKYVESEYQIPSDENVVAIAVERAQAENANPLEAIIMDDDIHPAHMRLHLEQLNLGELPDEETQILLVHVKQHQAKMMEILSETPKLKRVPWHDFVYDPDVPWNERTWEAERKSERVIDLINDGCRNVNADNLPVEQKIAQDTMEAYEDMTVSTWTIHDLRDGKEYKISAEGPEDGYFLSKGEWIYKDADGDIDIYYPLAFRRSCPDQVHGESTIQASIPLLDRLAEVDYYIDRHVATHAQYKDFYPKGSMSDDDLAAINDPNRRHVGLPPEALLGMKKSEPPPIPQTLLDQRATLLAELRRLIGIDAQDTAASNPHRITATESQHRATVRNERQEERQERMSEFLTWAAKGFLRLFRKFGTKPVSTRTLEPQGGQYFTLSPNDIPVGFDVLVDIKNSTERVQATKIQSAITYDGLLKTSGVAYDSTKWLKAVGRWLGINKPEQFFLPVPQGVPQGVMQQQVQNPGQPGGFSQQYYPQNTQADQPMQRSMGFESQVA